MTSFIIALLFMAGPGSAEARQTLRCADMPCVERVISRARESRMLARLRVFRADGYAALPLSGASVFPPLLDLWMQ